MVRETRHLWVGNLPDNIREDRIREHFKRYGRVQNVKLLGRTDSISSGVVNSGNSGVCATVAFMDIKSASKAHNAEHVLDERTLTTEYYEPTAIPSVAGAPSAGSSPAGSGYSGSSSSVNSTPAPASVSRYHMSGSEDNASSTCPLAASAAAPANWRGTNDSATEFCRRGNTPSAYCRTTPHQRWYASGERTTGTTGGESTPSTPGGCTEGGRRRRHSGSGSSRSDSSSPEPSDTSRASTPATQPPLSHHTNHRTPPTSQHQWASTTNGRLLAICVRNLPTRSTDSSLKDGLYHEYKKHGKVVWVKVVGQNADRYAVVRFKKPSDVEKALEVSQDKLFFGCKISVAPHQSCDEDADSAKPYETDIDEYHPKATRTLFIGNLEKDVTQQQLREKFKHFGRIIEIDIKKGSGGGAGYAFCQYASISSVVEAIRAMDGEYVGGSRVKLGFGKPVATTCVWVDGLTEHTEKQVLGAVSRCGAVTSVCVDRAAGAALVHFEQATAAGAAVRELRRVAAAASAAEPDHPRLCVDYASRECQDAFYEQLEKHGGSAALTGSERLTTDLPTRYLPTRHESIRYDGCGSRSRASSYGRGSSRTPRYSSLEHYDPTEYAADRRYRVFDDQSPSPQNEEGYEDRLQSVVVSPHRARRHRRDSSPEDRKRSKERHRSGARRSRSGSRGGERHGARRRHRRRRDDCSGSRAGTPLRDEHDLAPAEPRRPPRERPPLPMSLPLPKFAAQLLRTTPQTPRLHPPPAPAPDSPPRPPSASSSSGGSEPHSPSLEERIRSLDEKYEKWSGSRVLTEPPDRTRLRHRLLEIDINEVKPSDVVRSLLAKRSVFDEDSERLESVVRAPSPTRDVRSRSSSLVRSRYAFSSLPQLQPQPPPPLSVEMDGECDPTDRPADPRLNRPERPPRIERLGKFNESDYRLDERPGPHTPPATCTITTTAITLATTVADSKEGSSKCDNQNKEPEFKDNILQKLKLDIEFECDTSSEHKIKDQIFSRNKFEDISKINVHEGFNHLSKSNGSNSFDPIATEARDVMDMLLKRVDNFQEQQKTDFVKKRSCKLKNEDSIECNMNTKDQYNKIKLSNAVTNHRDGDICTEVNILNIVNNKQIDETEAQLNHLEDIISMKIHNDISATCKDLLKACEQNGKDKLSYNILDAFQNNKFEKENIQFDKSLDNDKLKHSKPQYPYEKKLDSEKTVEDRSKHDREKSRHSKDQLEINMVIIDKEKCKNLKSEKEKDKKVKEDHDTEKLHNNTLEKIKVERDSDRSKEKTERDLEKCKIIEEKFSRDIHQKREKSEKDKRKDSCDSIVIPRSKKEDKYKYDKSKKDSETKHESKKDPDSHKTRKSSRDETSREMARKDSTDSSTSRTSHESSKIKESENKDFKEEFKLKPQHEYLNKYDSEKDFLFKPVDIKSETKTDYSVKIKSEIKEEKKEYHCKNKEIFLEQSFKVKDVSDKQRHYSVDSPSVDSKRKERLNSCSSLPSTIGHKRRMSSQDCIDYLNDEMKKCRSDSKFPERRESKDSRVSDRHKTTKFSKGHFAKLIESKTKDDKKNQVKTSDQGIINIKEGDKIQKHNENSKVIKRSPKEENEKSNIEMQPDGLHKDLDFLATLELRSSEEDERQKALRKEMKEKKRIQQLQQIQELQMQQDALQHGEVMGKLKDDKKQKIDERKKEIARDKRMSIDRKSRDEKYDSNKRKNRKQIQTSDSSDSDEPKKHSIFDIIDDGPTYISMYDKVKARSCKNMQKQEEEKRQEKIKAKFSQLKQCRAKREEKKRSSWDEDSDSDQDRRKNQKSSMDNSSDEENIVIQCKKQHKSNTPSPDYDPNKSDECYAMTCNDEGLRNKIHSRKNSRTRILSDTSDEEDVKRSGSKSPNCYFKQIKNVLNSPDLLEDNKIESNHFRESDSHMIKKKSLFNLFGKSDTSDDAKIKSCFDIENDCKAGYVKSLSNDFSSESETMIPSRNVAEVRRKHKKKLKKHKFAYSDEELRKEVENSDTSAFETENKHKSIEKRRHSNKKDKRREKIRDSTDTDDIRDEKNKKKDKKIDINSSCECNIESVSAKKEGKMEDIFGPLSDESDKDTKNHQIKSDVITCEQESTLNSLKKDLLCKNISIEMKMKEKDELKRRKDKKRKEKRMSKDDENSLDVDAVSKAIEARLFADADNDNVKTSTKESVDKIESVSHKFLHENVISNENTKLDKLRKDCKEKKKKKKRNKEDRQFRKDHHFYHQDNFDKSSRVINTSEKLASESPMKTSLVNIPLPNDVKISDAEAKSEDCVILTESPSLPRLTDSPPIARHLNEENKIEEKSQFLHVEDKTINNDREVLDKLTAAEPHFESRSKSDEPLSERHDVVIDLDKQSSNVLITPTKEPNINNENSVLSVSDIESEEINIEDKNIEKSETQTCKVEKKVEEKPRAIISQEETEDAVAALLGESFGGKTDTFSGYEDAENHSTNQNEIEISTTETDNIPEEDAEEMRQAVQNLNASEMEMKPDTPVSDSDLLLIDTDTEETDETGQDAIEKLPLNIIATSQSLTNTNVEQLKSTDLSNVIITKLKPNVTQPLKPETSDCNPRTSEVKIHLAKRENIQIISSTATPVITTWALANSKSIESHVLNINNLPNTNTVPKRDIIEAKPTHITANIMQIRTPSTQNMQTNNLTKGGSPVTTRMNTPFQVIGQQQRARTPQLQPQPPTIKIPEPHILYQRPQSIVISPRMTNEPKLLSPKANTRVESTGSPRVTNMILSGTPQNVSSASPRSSGQVTVVRVPQLPALGVGSVGGLAGTRALLSPPRPGSVLVPTPGSTSRYGRLPVAPVLTPVSKQITVANVVTSNKIPCSISTQSQHQKISLGECGKLEHRNDIVTEHSKLILSPTSLQRSTNPTIMAQNRLIMQNPVHVGNVSTALHMNNKVLVNSVNHLSEKRDHQIKKSEQLNHVSFSPSPVLHVTGMNHSSASLIPGNSKSVMCNVQDTNTINRCQGPNVIHTFSTQGLVPTPSISNMMQLDSKKGSVLSIRAPTVLTKLEGPTGAVTTSSFSNVSPLLFKTNSSTGPIRLSSRIDKDDVENKCKTIPLLQYKETKSKEGKEESSTLSNFNNTVKMSQNSSTPDSTPSSTDQIAKCETDFEELLKDNTNEIKVTNDPDKKLEVNVGKNLTLITTNNKCSNKTNNISIKEDVSNTSLYIKHSEHPYSQPHNMKFKENPIEQATNCQHKQQTSIVIDVTPQCPLQDNVQNESNLTKNVSKSVSSEKNIDEEFCSTEEKLSFSKSSGDAIDDNIKHLDDNESWSAKDVNIESVIKKVDSLCNENTENDKSVLNEPSNLLNSGRICETMNQSVSKLSDDVNIPSVDCAVIQEVIIEKSSPLIKRGGRNFRGKKNEKHQDRIQTRQISKPARGTASKRGRGRAKVDKKIKHIINKNTNTMPGDVYDFHDDSGDEAETSPTKNETRPRLILTIKSPISGLSNITATSSLSISQKDHIKTNEKINKDEKSEDFTSPCLNTRKSRRLQEKDVQRNTVDDVIEDVVKGTVVQNKSGKDSVKKRPNKQLGVKMNNVSDKIQSNETRKSPRGVKRPRDTSLSDASVESGDEKGSVREEEGKEAKIPRTADSIVSVTSTSFTSSTSATVNAAPMPITKPPKKMISEISAKLGCAFEASPGERTVPQSMEVEKQAQVSVGLSGANECGGEMSAGRRPLDGMPGPPLAAGAAGAAEPGDARVMSPALPHRPPSLPPTTHRPADRATPILAREGTGEAELGIAGGVAPVGAGGAAGVRGWRGAYAATASLPRGAHHPSPPQPQPPHPQQPYAHHPLQPNHPQAQAQVQAALEPHAHPIKHIAVVPPHQPLHQGPTPRLTVTSVPSMSPQGQQIPPAEGLYPHFSHQHYQMYQQHFRATQHESRTTPSPYTRSLEAEGCEAPTPPLELRRPPSARVPRPAHSPAHSPSHVDRHIMYAVRCGRSPPPAHGTSRLPGALPPTTAPGPPHASQVPREADSLQMLLRRYPVMWQGLLALKNDSAAVQMHFVGGNPVVAGDTLSRHSDGSTPLLRIAQRMRLEQAQLEQVHRKMKVEQEHCTLLALPCGRDHMDVLQQSTNLSAGFITYLQRKQAAGIVNIAPPGHHQAMFTVHIFPSCDFANENLNRIAPDLMHRVADIAHLLIVIATV